jgi:hypothetical protein
MSALGQKQTFAPQISDVRFTCPFRKFHPAQIRIVRQNHHIIESVSALVTEHGNAKEKPINIVLLGFPGRCASKPLIR